MNPLNIKPGLPVLAAFTLGAATASVAADRETSEHVTVQDGQPTTKVIDRTEADGQTGAQAGGQTDGQFESIELHGEVNYSDLALNLPSNEKVFRARVHEAAREVCTRLYQMYPDSTGEDCVYRAEQDAMPQVTAAISAAEARKSAAR